jgi:hypothetical protein
MNVVASATNDAGVSALAALTGAARAPATGPALGPF